MNTHILIHKTHTHLLVLIMKSFLKHSSVPTLLMHFLSGVLPPLWPPFLGCNSVTLPFRLCFGCLQEQQCLCSNQESIMKHCLLQYQAWEVSTKLIGRENILPSSSGRAWSQEKWKWAGGGWGGQADQLSGLEEKFAGSWKNFSWGLKWR